MVTPVSVLSQVLLIDFLLIVFLCLGMPLIFDWMADVSAGYFCIPAI